MLFVLRVGESGKTSCRAQNTFNLSLSFIPLDQLHEDYLLLIWFIDNPVPPFSHMWVLCGRYGGLDIWLTLDQIMSLQHPLHNVLSAHSKEMDDFFVTHASNYRLCLTPVQQSVPHVTRHLSTLDAMEKDYQIKVLQSGFQTVYWDVYHCCTILKSLYKSSTLPPTGFPANNRL